MSRVPDNGDDSTATGKRPAPGADETDVTIDDRPPRAEKTEQLAFGTRIDRFLVLEKLGEGGMGTVYAAYDTLLDRKVAMKVVRPDRRHSRAALSPRERLLREAQAMARLHHPNVVAVLDVGELGENVYLALELVEGQTLKAWLREKPRSWRDVVAAFVEAGRGLAAAHAAGLVHRDVKPDNILAGKDGRIRITDFGVVSMHRKRDSGDSDRGDAGSDEDTLSGLRVGTPAYMPPEQYAGESVDARADQFSFCVSLWEGLFGQRPFDASSRGESLSIRDIPRDTSVPGWLVAVLRRGLASDVAARWPSIDALLDELTRDRGKRRRIAITALLASLLAGSITLALLGWTRDREEAAALCKNEARHLAGVWDGARADELAASLRATGAPGADAASRRVRGHLDMWARDWIAARTSACEATRIHGDQSEALLDARMHCLDRHLVRVREIVRELVRADVNRATEITSDLPDVRACGASESLTAAPADPLLRGRVAVLESELARVSAVEQTGRYPAALALALPLVAQAEATRHRPIHAEVLAAVGRLRVQTGEHAGGISALREAATLAAGADADAVAASASIELVWATADSGRAAEALAVAAAVAPTVARVHDPALDALLASTRGDAQMFAGDLERAATELERALVLTEAAVGRDHVRVAQVLNRLGGLEDRRGRATQARTYYTRALAIVDAKLGPEHPSSAITRANLCYLDAEAERTAEAAACYEKVIATLEAALGPRHRQVAWALNDAGLVEQARGHFEQARAYWERSRAIYERSADGASSDLAWPLVNLGALALRERDLAGAEALCRKAIDVIEKSGGADEGAMFDPWVCLGAALVERRPAEAIALLERALRLDDAQYDAHGRGTARFALARATEARGDRARAVANAREALAAFDEAGAGAGSDRTEVATWLERHGGAPGP